MGASAADHYEVRFRETGTLGWSDVYRAPALAELALDGLDRTRQYDFEARSVSACGAKSVWVGVNYTIPLPPPLPTPTVPTTLGVVDGIQIDWGDADGDRGDITWEVQRAAALAGPWTTIAKVKGSSWTDTLADSGNYYYRVRSIDFFGNVGAWQVVAGPGSVSISTVENINQEIIDRIAAVAQEAQDRADAIVAEAAARADALLNEQLTREAAITTEQTIRQSADDSLAQSISTLAAGTGEQFDSKKVWYFDTDLESWTGNGAPTVANGYLRPAAHATDPWVASPVFPIDGAAYKYLKARIKRVGAPTWQGVMFWATVAEPIFSGHSVTIPEPAFDADGDATIDFKDVPWAGDVNRWRLDLSTAQTATDYFLIDWVAIGRPTPGASIAALQDESTARITGDAAEAAQRTTLATQMRGGYTGTDVEAVTSGLLYAERQARSTADSAMASDITALEATVDDPVTGVEATASAMTALDARVTSAEGVNTAQASSITNIKASLSGSGNLIPNCGFEADLAGWAIVSATIPSPLMLRDNPNASWVIVGTHCLALRTVGATTAGQYARAYSQLVAVDPTQSYIASTWFAVDRCNATLYVFWYDAAGSFISASNVPFTDQSTGGNTFDKHTRVYFKANPPANATRARVVLELLATGENDPYLWCTRPMLEQVGAEQTTPSPWNDANTGLATATQLLDVRVTSTEAGVASYQASWSVLLDVNGRISGVTSINDGNSSSFTVLADKFGVYSPLGDSLTWSAGIITSQKGSNAVKLGAGIGVESDPMILYYGPAGASSTRTLALAKVGITAGGKTKLAGTWSNYVSGWDSGAAITTSWTTASPAVVTISVAAGVFNTSGQTISYSASSANVSQARSTTVKYYLYYSDAGQSGGAKTLNISTDYRVQYNNPDNVFVGSVSVAVPASGTGGGGGQNPCVSVDSRVIRRAACGAGEEARAGDIRVGDYLRLVDGRWGRVTYSQRAWSARVRVKGCASLTCSTSAPLGLVGGGQVLAPAARGALLDALCGEARCTDRITRMEDAGPGWVQHITCEDAFFWARDRDNLLSRFIGWLMRRPRRYLSHHNIKFDPV